MAPARVERTILVNEDRPLKPLSARPRPDLKNFMLVSGGRRGFVSPIRRKFSPLIVLSNLLFKSICNLMSHYCLWIKY